MSIGNVLNLQVIFPSINYWFLLFFGGNNEKKKNYKQVSKSDPDHGRINCKSAAAENHTEKQSTEKGEHSSKFTMAPQDHTVNLVPVETW